jgi:hypothetical protein
MPTMEDMRYEIKMECEQELLPQVRSWVNSHSAGFCRAYPPRQVNSLYLDTHSMDTLNDHLESVPTRRKLRYRWYGKDISTACGHLELKNKTERAGWKINQTVQAMLRLDRDDWTTIQQQMLCGIDGSEHGMLFQEVLRVSRPLILNCYDREYYVTSDSRVRLTIDMKQKVFSQWLTVRPNLTFQTPTLDILIIEFKCDVAHGRYLTDILSEFPLRIHRHSKFINAVDGIQEY